MSNAGGAMTRPPSGPDWRHPPLTPENHHTGRNKPNISECHVLLQDSMIIVAMARCSN
ncbi:hypothetical protein PR003_g12396 [Phytophthora rubi]|uniref:Uncharacterized protein n=2 Tax=Phytophthora TaxID=4783 RepID=A0A6A3M741_9STRA|nr:hypothetical protein PF003_g18216 [Phytophthora fragariae]KAE8974694.1 hypothetical protein PR002_g25833 [Phytophthora rubi]KAE9025910.1 hypothetical protein PF011_g2818 [Phytophthora fragariae]KAE9237022.1 hypothetical protein PF004_g8686 [Phytophthora fragariae]KAE9317863.1 hypothetical protein PF001_g6647 [Phytophthora fragariae]